MHEHADPATVASIVADLKSAAAQDQASFAKEARALGARIASQWWLINGCAIDATPQTAATLRQNPRVAYVIPDRVHFAKTGARVAQPPQDSAAGAEGHNAVEAHRRGYTAAGQVYPVGTPQPSIAVLDSQLEWFDSATSSQPSNSSAFNNSAGSTRIAESVRAANIGANPNLQAYRTNFANSVYNSTNNLPLQHGNGIAHAAAGRAPLPSDPTPTAGVGQAPNARILSIDIIEDYTQIASRFGCTPPASARWSSTIAITDACQFLATYAAQYNTLAAVCAFGGSGNPWSPEQQAMDSLVRNSDIVMCVPSGNYFEDGALELGAWPSSDDTDNVNFRRGRDATAWDSMYGANSIVAGAARAGSKVVPTWSGAGPLTPARSSQSSSPLANQYGTTYCAGFVPDNYFSVPNQSHDFSRQYPDLVAVGAAITIQERSLSGSPTDVLITVDGSSVSCGQVAGAALLYRAGLDGSAGGAPPSALETRAILLASAEDVAARQPAYTGGPTGENLLGAGFMRTDHALLGDARTQAGSLAAGPTQQFQFSLDANSTYGIALAWHRSEFSMTPPPNVWPTTQPQPNGLPWANFDMVVQDGAGGSFTVASTYGNRTWEHARVTTQQAQTLTVSVYRTGQGSVPVEPFALSVVKLTQTTASPAIAVVPVAGGPNPCRSRRPMLGGSAGAIGNSLPTAPSVGSSSFGAAPFSTTFHTLGARSTNVTPVGTFDSFRMPGIFRGVGALQGTSLSVPIALRGPNRTVQIGLTSGPNATPSIAGREFLAVDLACESDRDMQLRARLIGVDANQNRATVEGRLEVRAGSRVARAVFGRTPGSFDGPSAATGGYWRSTFLPPNPPYTGVDQWAFDPSNEFYLFEFEAPAGLRFLSRHAMPQGFSTSQPLPSNFSFQNYAVRVGTSVNGTVANWSAVPGNSSQLVAAQMWTADDLLSDSQPEIAFSTDALSVGHPYSAHARGFELTSGSPAAYLLGLGASATAQLFSGTTGGLPCDCPLGIDLSSLLVNVPLVATGGAVAVPEVVLPYDPNTIGLDLFHQIVAIEPSQLVRSSELVRTRVDLR
ncbi:MAG: hypothetical protein AB8H80_05020 [Planctomycetota bacterium]